MYDIVTIGDAVKDTFISPHNVDMIKKNYRDVEICSDAQPVQRDGTGRIGLKEDPPAQTTSDQGRNDGQSGTQTFRKAA